MLIIIDKKIPEQAKENLSKYGDVLELSTKNITYDAISGHPDIFFCKINNRLIVAPNLPDNYLSILKKNHIKFIKGEKPVKSKYPETAYYNAVVTNKFIIHHFDITDPVILDNTGHLKKLYVSQGYSRCNLLALKNQHFITSDKGIFKILSEFGFQLIYVSPKNIVLPGFNNGFFGGACGVFKDKVFIIGNLKFFPAGEDVRNFLHKLDYKIIELYDGPLFDGGSILLV
ncbi:MAG: hypothetical protein K8R58_01920 [Bacteroidales bacterium]|nr:hypothetical protein [Bacteroidales bacterium]